MNLLFPHEKIQFSVFSIIVPPVGASEVENPESSQHSDSDGNLPRWGGIQTVVRRAQRFVDRSTDQPMRDGRDIVPAGASMAQKIEA